MSSNGWSRRILGDREGAKALRRMATGWLHLVGARRKTALVNNVAEWEAIKTHGPDRAQQHLDAAERHRRRADHVRTNAIPQVDKELKEAKVAVQELPPLQRIRDTRWVIVALAAVAIASAAFNVVLLLFVRGFIPHGSVITVIIIGLAIGVLLTVIGQAIGAASAGTKIPLSQLMRQFLGALILLVMAACVLIVLIRGAEGLVDAAQFAFVSPLEIAAVIAAAVLERARHESVLGRAAREEVDQLEKKLRELEEEASTEEAAVTANRKSAVQEREKATWAGAMLDQVDDLNEANERESAAEAASILGAAETGFAQRGAVLAPEPVPEPEPVEPSWRIGIPLAVVALGAVLLIMMLGI